jgi:hypothetical protein
MCFFNLGYRFTVTSQGYFNRGVDDSNYLPCNNINRSEY